MVGRVVEVRAECAVRGGEGRGGRIGGGGTSSKCKGNIFRVRCSIEKTVDNQRKSLK